MSLKVQLYTISACVSVDVYKYCMYGARCTAEKEQSYIYNPLFPGNSFIFPIVRLFTEHVLLHVNMVNVPAFVKLRSQL